MNIKGVMFGVIVLLFAVSLVGTIADNVHEARYSANATLGTNITGASNTIVGLTTLLFAVGVVMLGYNMLFKGNG